MASHFGDRLFAAVKSKGTMLTVGLDPVAERLPEEFRGGSGDVASAVEGMYNFCVEVLGIVSPLVPAVKINSAFFERERWKGLEVYYSVIGKAKEAGVEVIGDVKRGDIGHTAGAYAEGHLGSFEDIVLPDAITVNGYFGADGIEPFVETANREGKGVFVLVRTSNPSAGSLQDFTDSRGERMFERMAEVVGRIAEEQGQIGKSGYSNVGMVVGGTSGEETSSLREKYSKVWFLVPGFGAQGAGASDCVRFCRADGTGALVNSSRSIIYAYENEKYRSKFGDDWRGCIKQAVLDARQVLLEGMGFSKA